MLLFGPPSIGIGMPRRGAGLAGMLNGGCASRPRLGSACLTLWTKLGALMCRVADVVWQDGVGQG